VKYDQAISNQKSIMTCRTVRQAIINREGQTMLFDPSTPFGARLARRLREEQVIWLTTVGLSGTPQPNPVWFLWDGNTFLIYAQPASYKVRNLHRNPRVSLNFDSGADGEDVMVFTGSAVLDESAPLAHQHPAYLEKYRSGIADIEMTPQSMGESYNVAIRVRPDKVRGF
jgi:PPOX class probable F420-dependent enzyme